MVFPCLLIEQAKCFNPIPSVTYCLSATKYFNGIYWYLNNSQSKGNPHNYEQMVVKVFDNHISTRLKNKTIWLITGRQYYPKVIRNASSKITPLMLSLILCFSALKKDYLNLIWPVANKQEEHSYTYLVLWERYLVFAFPNMKMNLIADHKMVQFQMKTCNYDA